MIQEFVQKAIDKIASAENEIKLNLRFERIDHEEARALAEAIKLAKYLVTLNLYGKNIGDEGAKALADAIAVASVSVPVTLNLWNNNIKSEGAKALAGAIAVASVSVPVTLNLWDNDIGDEGAKALEGAIKKAKHPVSLNFFESDTGEGAEDLKVALRINKIKHEYPINAIKEFLSTVTFQGNLVNAIANYKAPELSKEEIQQYIDGSTKLNFNASLSKEKASKVLARTLFYTVEAPFSGIPLEIRELILSKIKDGKYLENLVLQVYKEIKDANSNSTAVGEASGGEENMEVVATDEDPDDNSGGGDAEKPSDSLSSDSNAEAQESSNVTNIFYEEAPKELILRLVDTVEDLSGKANEYEESVQELESEKGLANITLSQFPELDPPEKYVDTQHVLGGMVSVGSHFA